MAQAVQVVNERQVIAALAAVLGRVHAADEVIEEATAEIVAADAARRAPRLTGHLQMSTRDEGGTVVAATGYSAYVEYGTRRHGAQPFLRPARELGESVIRRMGEQAYTAATR